MSESESSPVGAILAITETLGLGAFGIDHLLMASAASGPKNAQLRSQHFAHATLKLSLLVGTVVLFYVLRKVIKIPLRDPLYIFPVLTLVLWGIWALHDALWVILGSLLNYKCILNADTSAWQPYLGYTRMYILVTIFLFAIVAWHFLWYFSGQS